MRTAVLLAIAATALVLAGSAQANDPKIAAQDMLRKLSVGKNAHRLSPANLKNTDQMRSCNQTLNTLRAKRQGSLPYTVRDVYASMWYQAEAGGLIGEAVQHCRQLAKAATEEVEQATRSARQGVKASVPWYCFLTRHRQLRTLAAGDMAQKAEIRRQCQTVLAKINEAAKPAKLLGHEINAAMAAHSGFSAYWDDLIPNLRDATFSVRGGEDLGGLRFPFAPEDMYKLLAFSWQMGNLSAYDFSAAVGTGPVEDRLQRLFDVQLPRVTGHELRDLVSTNWTNEAVLGLGHGSK